MGDMGSFENQLASLQKCTLSVKGEFLIGLDDDASFAN
jgi:hypothetical protein